LVTQLASVNEDDEDQEDDANHDVDAYINEDPVVTDVLDVGDTPLGARNDHVESDEGRVNANDALDNNMPASVPPTFTVEGNDDGDGNDDTVDDSDVVAGSASLLPPVPFSLSYSINLDSSDDDNDEEATPPCSLPEKVPMPKRYVGSARECYPLQLTGIRDVKNAMLENGIIPLVFGKPKHYEWIDVWGATSELHHHLVGTKIRNLHGSADVTPPKASLFTDVFSIVEEPKKRRGRRLNRDLKKYVFSIHTSDKEIWPKCNAKKVSSVKTAS
jgi:hypothetical protein